MFAFFWRPSPKANLPGLQAHKKHWIAACLGFCELAVSVVLVDPAMSQLFFLVDDVASVNLIRKEREDSRILVSLLTQQYLNFSS